MRLHVWAKKMGISYRSAWRWFHSGKLPVAAEQLPSGVIIVKEKESSLENKETVIYARVSSHDQKEDLRRQAKRLEDFCSSRGMIISNSVSEIGSGLNGKRPKLLSILKNPSVSNIVVEHKDRLTRFGFDYLEACLSSQNRKIIVINETEQKEDLVQDLIDVVTSMCAKIYGRRSSKNRAEKAMRAINENS